MPWRPDSEANAIAGLLASPGEVRAHIEALDAQANELASAVDAARAHLPAELVRGWDGWRGAWSEFLRSHQGLLSRLRPRTTAELGRYASSLDAWRSAFAREGVEAGVAVPAAAVRESVRACLGSAPVPMPARVTSAAGYRRSARTGARQFHEGADFHAPEGTLVLAVTRGHVHAVFADGDPRTHGYGHFVVLYHPASAEFTAYAHLSAVEVRAGQLVDAGTVLGASGRTTGGRFPGMGAHLHFAVRRARRSGEAPWPGPYPDPERARAFFREVWVDPLELLDRLGLAVEGYPRVKMGALRIRPRSLADCDGAPVAPRLASRSVSRAVAGARRA
ncbi:MAG: M23 family metallopeptidase [Sandaracinaceae bacterium]|nr:M23 family metallopeptidase [Sandaracinaceae bacterium]